MDKFVYKTFEFCGKGKKIWIELASSHPAYEKNLVKFDFEEGKFKVIDESCINNADLKEAENFANKLNEIAKEYGVRTVYKNEKGRIVKNVK